jgi:anaerobic selenocysteine-containing dehydrogenase
MSEAKTTTDHNKIRKWVEERGGHPARVKGTEDKSGGGLLRIDYPGYSGEGKLEEISWEEFFEEFDDSNLAFLHQDKTADGEQSRFSKLVTREKGKSASKR